MGFVLECAVIVIPELVEADQIGRWARQLAKLDPEIPLTVQACQPDFALAKRVKVPDVTLMAHVMNTVREAGLNNVRCSNPSPFITNEAEEELYRRLVDTNVRL